ncbi:C27B7.6 [Symbiodinium natans]|uniref:C27B7.6 protein n=1 Tax=Symbiodinium natans TaxID=878477 RepID=A0A812Q2X7_9DINO|nr:C27B7.6 [Symbiodinium natans]
MTHRPCNAVAGCFVVWLCILVPKPRPVLFASLRLDARALQDLRAGRARNSTKQVVPKRRRFAPNSPAERLLWTLGCELWSAGRDMALAGGSVAKGEIGASPAEFLSGPTATTSHLPTFLGNGGSALQDAGAALLDGAWRRAWRRLEAASRTSQEYWPASGFTGLIDLVFIVADTLCS